MATRIYTELPPPDVEVEVVAATTSPTILTPTLPPVVVGPCYQIVEVTDSDGSTNADSLVTLPAVIRSVVDQNYTIAAGPLTVIWKVNNGATLTTSFPTAVYTAAQVVSIFNATTNLSGALAEVVEGVADSRFQLRTTEEGEFKSLTITGGTALAALGLPAVGVSQEFTVAGYSMYDMTKMRMSPQNFYDAGRDNMDELDFQADDIIVAYDDGSGTLQTLSRTSTVERWGVGAVRIFDDGDADNYSPIFRVPNTCTPTNVHNLNSVAGVAVMTAVGAYVAPAAGAWIGISVDGSQYHRVEFDGTEAAIGAAVTKINEEFSYLGAVLASDAAGSIRLTAGDGTVDGKGSESCILLDSASTATLGIGFGTAGGNQERTIGTWWAVEVGDSLYVDGVFRGYVTRVYPTAGAYCDVRLDRELAETTFAGASHAFYFVANNLSAAWVSSTAPTPDLYVDDDGNVIVKHRVLRASSGGPSTQTVGTPAAGTFKDSGHAYVYVGYTALRLDVSPSADEPSLLSFETTTDIEDEIGPISTANPLALAAYLTKVAAPGYTTHALGIDAISADAPEGTSTAYSTAMEFLESEHVWCIVPLTQDRDIIDLFKAHAVAMSATARKRERVIFGTITQPERAPDTIVASGTTGNTTGVVNEFNTGISTLSGLLLAAGVDPAAIVVADDVYLDIESTALNYNITGAVTGPVVAVNVTFAAGENEDGFYTLVNLPASLINETWSLKVRGAELVTGTGAPDKLAIAQALADIALGFGTKRTNIGQPDTVIISMSGIETAVPSYYAAAVEAGKAAVMSPQQGFTNTPTTGILRVQGASDFFSETQLNIAAGGGIWWWFQQTANSAVTCRHQLTTDVSTVLNKEWSLTKTLDFMAFTIRENFRPFLGRYNINKDLLSILSAVMSGVCLYFTDTIKCCQECEFSGFEQDATDPTILDVVLDATLEYPFNKLRVKIRV